MYKIVLIALLLLGSASEAFWGTSTKIVVKTVSAICKHPKALRKEEIVKLSKLSDEAGGTKKVKYILGKKNLPLAVQEDAYMRIAIHQGKISRREAEEFYRNLSGKEGFRAALSKIIGNNPHGTAGHLNELKIANEGVKQGFDVVAIGKKFDDGIKNSLTDIDIVLRKNGREILIEAKDYSAATKMDLIKFKKDLDTLNIYDAKGSKNAIKVFSFTQKPQSEALLRQYRYWADRKGVQLIFGSPQEQIEQIKMLEKIL